MIPSAPRQPGLSSRFLFVFLVIATGLSPRANAMEVDNPFLPYPPGCATLPELQPLLYGANIAKVYQGRLPLVNARNVTETLDSIITVYRVACAEADRSVIWLEFTAPEGVDPQTLYNKPIVIARTDAGRGGRYMILAREPNSWGAGSWGAGVLSGSQQKMAAYASWGGTNAPGGSQVYVLDNESPTGWWDSPLSADQYNGSFQLGIQTSGERKKPDLVIQIPSTASVLNQNQRIPLNGRLSGNWVTDGASDQGFVIAISELAEKAQAIPADLAEVPLLLFLSWYTYGPGGEPMWLTGSAVFAMGATEISLPIERVSNGEFNGSKQADREVIGSAVISGFNCNDLGFEYELTALGLGSGSRHLRRLFSLEIAGYSCRDLSTRISEKGK